MTNSFLGIAHLQKGRTRAYDRHGLILSPEEFANAASFRLFEPHELNDEECVALQAKQWALSNMGVTKLLANLA